MLVTIGRRTVPEDLIGLLLECHGRIRSFTHLAAELGTRQDLPAEEVVDAAARVARYFREALPLHVEDEEQSLLPRLMGLDEELDAALATMHAQHEAHEPLLKELLQVLTALQHAPQDGAVRERLAAVATSLRAELETHLKGEERVIFPQAQRHLGDRKSVV